MLLFVHRSEAHQCWCDVIRCHLFHIIYELSLSSRGLCSTPLVIFLGTLFLTCFAPASFCGAGTRSPSSEAAVPTGRLTASSMHSGTFVTAQNFGPAPTRCGTASHSRRRHWASTPQHQLGDGGWAVDVSLGGYAAIDPLFFPRSGEQPGHFDLFESQPARVYLVQMLQWGTTLLLCGQFLMTNVFVTSSATLPVPAFSFGNSVAGENPPQLS